MHPPIFITADKEPPLHGVLSAALTWLGGALVIVLNGGKSISMGEVLYSTNWANYATRW